MVSIYWDPVGERFFEAGLDRGVFYRPDGKGCYDKGVAWVGLTAVDESSASGTAAAAYLDGMKVVDVQSHEDFAATLRAFTYPDEFLEYEGVESVADGIYIHDQKPKMFGMSYRTFIGNDVDNVDYGYRLHLLYNLTATPDNKTYTTESADPFLSDFSWQITGVPMEAPGYKPTAHIIIDSRYASVTGMRTLERILYGLNEDANPRLPTIPELLGISWGDRFIIVIERPEVALLPGNAIQGDVALSLSDVAAYSVGYPPSPDVRRVIAIAGSDISMLPKYAKPGDLVYDKTTAILYKYSLGGRV